MNAVLAWARNAESLSIVMMNEMDAGTGAVLAGQRLYFATAFSFRGREFVDIPDISIVRNVLGIRVRPMEGMASMGNDRNSGIVLLSDVMIWAIVDVGIIDNKKGPFET